MKIKIHNNPDSKLDPCQIPQNSAASTEHEPDWEDAIILEPNYPAKYLSFFDFYFIFLRICL